MSNTETTVTACRNCGTAIYLAAKNEPGVPMVGGTGPDRTEHWRHIRQNGRFCKRGNGRLAEPYDGSGPVAEELRHILAARGAES